MAIKRHGELKAMTPEERGGLFKFFGNIFSELGRVLVAMDLIVVLYNSFQKFSFGGSKERDGTLHLTWVVATIHKKSFHDLCSSIAVFGLVIIMADRRTFPILCGDHYPD
jgi:hypothetical protein